MKYPTAMGYFLVLVLSQNDRAIKVREELDLRIVIGVLVCDIS